MLDDFWDSSTFLLSQIVTIKQSRYWWSLGLSADDGTSLKKRSLSTVLRGDRARVGASPKRERGTLFFRKESKKMSNKKTFIVLQNEKEEMISKVENDFLGKDILIIKVGSEENPASPQDIKEIQAKIKEAIDSDEKTLVIVSSLDISVDQYSI